MVLILKVVNLLCKSLYWPLCRAYAKYIVKDKPADALFRFLCSFQFLRVYQFWPNFVHPVRFSEKLWNRMLNERDTRLTMISDKIKVRDYIAKKAGPEFLIPLLWSGNNPEQIPFEVLPAKFVIKTNHGCGYNIIVTDKTLLDHQKTKRQLRRWLSKNFCLETYIGSEWGYKNIKPCILVESFIEKNGNSPEDYKFYCFSGHVEIITLHIDRYGEHKMIAFNKHFELHESSFNKNPINDEFYCPSNFEAMVQLAESLSEEFNFIRVDLYSLENKIYFGELTPYPAGASFLHGFNVKSVDYSLSDKWVTN